MRVTYGTALKIKKIIEKINLQDRKFLGYKRAAEYLSSSKNNFFKIIMPLVVTKKGVRL